MACLLHGHWIHAQVSLAVSALSPWLNASHFSIHHVYVTYGSVGCVPFSPEVCSMVQARLLKTRLVFPIPFLKVLLVAFQWMGQVSNLVRVNRSGRFVNFLRRLPAASRVYFLVAMADLVVKFLVIIEVDVCGRLMSILWKSASLRTDC